jgi:hypothetical protein
MPTICVQCAMEAALKGEPCPSFDEEPDEHGRRVHPDPVKTQARRNELERLVVERFRRHLTS